MHDSFLLNKIADTLKQICSDNKLSKIKEAVIEVNYDSHIGNEDLHEHLVELIPQLVDNYTIITIKKAAIERQTAIIYMLKGEGFEAE